MDDYIVTNNVTSLSFPVIVYFESSSEGRDFVATGYRITREPVIEYDLLCRYIDRIDFDCKLFVYGKELPDSSPRIRRFMTEPEAAQFLLQIT